VLIVKIGAGGWLYGEGRTEKN